MRPLPLTLSLLLALAAPAGIAAERTILVYGDSLSAAYGMAEESGWVSLLRRRLAERGYGHRVVNASISGETTRGGLGRLPVTLETHTPQVVVIELGGNDGLQGHPIHAMQEDLTAMARLAQASGAAVVIVGMKLPPNYGARYTDAFEAAFQAVARQTNATLVPFLLEGIDLETMLQEDGIHPTAAAQPLLLDIVWPLLEPLLGPVEAATARRADACGVAC